jgi:putative transposase
VDRSITSDRLINELDRLALQRGYPAVLHCDNSPELACDAMADWADLRQPRTPRGSR